MLLAFVSLLSATVFSQEPKYDVLLKEIQDLESSESYFQAKQLIIENLNHYNDKWFELSKELIYCNEKLGNLEENLSYFKIAHNKGYFYFIHPRMPKYKPYKDFEDFDLISQRDLQLLREANEKSKTTYEVQLPENYKNEKVYPVIFLLHGGGKNLSDVKKHWQTPELNSNYIKVYVQSYRHFDSETFGWGSGDKRTEQDFRKLFKELLANYLIDTNKVIFGSISAGANPVIEMALRSIIPVKGYFVYCPNLPVLLKEQKFELIKDNNVRGYIVSGESDHFLPRQELMIELFDSLNLDYKYTIVKDMGHQYPIDEEKYISDGLKYILETKNQISKELDKYIKKRIDIGYSQGISIGIIDSTGTNFYNYGKAFINSKVTPTENTIYEIGSITKIFTSSIYSILLDEGVFNINDKVGSYFSKSELNGDVRKIKLIDLATHTSGLPSFPNNLNINKPGNFSIGYDYKDFYEFLKVFNTQKKGEYLYSNTGISLLAIVMEKATGKTYKELLEKYIIQELNMGSTFIKVPEKEQHRFAAGSSLFVEKDHWDLSDVFVPVGGMKSSVADLIKFLKTNLQLIDYKYSDSFIGSIEIQKEISENNYSGIGWKIRKNKDERIIWHSGNTGGFSGFVGISDDQKKGVVVLANSNLNVNEIGLKLLDEKTKLKELKNHICFELSKIIQQHSLDSAISFYKSELNKENSNYILGELQLIEIANAFITWDTNISNKLYNYALKMYPESPDVYISLIKTYLSQNEKSKAANLLKKAEVIFPDNVQVKNMLNALKQNEYEN